MPLVAHAIFPSSTRGYGTQTVRSWNQMSRGVHRTETTRTCGASALLNVRYLSMLQDILNMSCQLMITKQQNRPFFKNPWFHLSLKICYTLRFTYLL